MSELVLYIDHHWISPYALSAFVALEEKGVPYRIEELRFSVKAHQQPAYASRTQRVPSLRHDDFWLSESSAIVEYLDEVFPPPRFTAVLPTDPKQRALAREVMAWVRSDLMPIREERPTYGVWYERMCAPLSAAAQTAVDRLTRAAAQLIKPGRTSLFSAFSIADVDLAMMLQRLSMNGDALPAALTEFANAVWARPSVQRWHTHPRPPFEPY